MSQPAIIIENLSKQYRLGDVGTGTLSHDLKRWWYAVRGKEDPFAKVGETNDRTQKGNSEYVWALKDINLQINQGDAVGIIGRNGAGKSTLLKLLSKTTAPTSGSIKVKGRIASLLEVGTGFHPELSGRDNIYLNGAILGMRKREIDRKLDEIVDFAGIERYLDTPVKRYSSGMYVRLAFAVAAHLDSDILIVDEVLAVGDAEFQKKCLGKMGEVSQGQGRTVLFVSHNMEAIATLCQSLIILKHGNKDFDGHVDKGIPYYLNGVRSTDPFVDFSLSRNQYFERFGHNQFGQFLNIEIRKNDLPNSDFKLGDSIEIKANLLLKTKSSVSEFGAVITNARGQRLHHLVSSWKEQYADLQPGKYSFSIITEPIQLYPSDYSISIWFRANDENASDDFIENAIQFTVSKNDEQSFQKLDRYCNNGGVFIKYQCKLEQEQ